MDNNTNNTVTVNELTDEQKKEKYNIPVNMEPPKAPWPTWKRVGLVLLIGFGLIAALLGAAYAIYVGTYGSITSPVQGDAGEYRMVAYAATDDPVTAYSAEELLLIEDNTLEYGEISALVERYNPTYRNQLESFYANPAGNGVEMGDSISVTPGAGVSRDGLLAMANDLRNEAADLKAVMEEIETEIDDLEDAGDTAGVQAKEAEYDAYKAEEKALRKYARELEDAAEGNTKEGRAQKRALRITKNQLTAQIQAAMRGHQALSSQHEIQLKRLEIAQIAYEGAMRQRDLGLYSAENLKTAEDSYRAAQYAAQASEAALTKSRQALITTMGWGYNAQPVIIDVPEPDVSRIASYNFATDVEAAVSNHYDLSDIRKTDKSSFGGAADKRKEVKRVEDAVRMQFESVFRNVQQKQASWEAQKNGFEAAKAAKDQADRKWSLGMISRAEYLQAEVTWMTAEASMEQAGLDLTAAMEDYEWALKGLMNVPTATSAKASLSSMSMM